MLSSMSHLHQPLACFLFVINQILSFNSTHLQSPGLVHTALLSSLFYTWPIHHDWFAGLRQRTQASNIFAQPFSSFIPLPDIAPTTFLYLQCGVHSRV